METEGPKTSRWIDAVWNPTAGIYSLPCGIESFDFYGDGDNGLIIADLGSSISGCKKIRFIKGRAQLTEYLMSDIPCAVTGFYMENENRKSAALAIGSGSSVFIFKNMKPYFKFCLAQHNAHPKEINMWYKAAVNDESSLLVLIEDLAQLLKEIDAVYLSARTLKFLSLEEKHRRYFFEQHRRLPLFKTDVVTILGTIPKDSWSEIACSYLIIGTEYGEILILDTRAFFVIDKYIVGWPPIAMSSSGLWLGDGKIILASRDGKIGTIKRGTPFKFWETLSSPAVALAALHCGGVAIATGNSSFSAYSEKGVQLWNILLPGNPLDLVKLAEPQSDLSLLAISIAGSGIKIYNHEYYVDSIKIFDSISSLKFGKLGQEEYALIMVTCGGGFSIKILNGIYNLFVPTDSHSNTNSFDSADRFTLPKKTKCFIEQAIRGREEALNIHRIFQKEFLKLRIDTAIRAQVLIMPNHEFGPADITLKSSTVGLGPAYIVNIIVVNMNKKFINYPFFIICRENDVFVHPRTAQLPSLATNNPVSITFSVTTKIKILSKIEVLLCRKGQIRPVTVIDVILPIEEDAEA